MGQFSDRNCKIVERGVDQTTSGVATHKDLLNVSDYIESHDQRGQTTIRVVCHVTGKDDSNSEYGSYRIEALFKETVAGGFVQEGSSVLTVLQEDNPSWSVDLEENSDIIQLQITGITSRTIDWEYEAEMYILQKNANMAPPLLQIQISGMTGEESWGGMTNGTYQVSPIYYARGSASKSETWMFAASNDSFTLSCNGVSGTSYRRLYWYSQATSLTTSITGTGVGSYLDTGAIISDSITVGAITIAWQASSGTGSWWGNSH